jgi:hypothetical protein
MLLTRHGAFLVKGGSGQESPPCFESRRELTAGDARPPTKIGNAARVEARKSAVNKSHDGQMGMWRQGGNKTSGGPDMAVR